MWLRELFNQHKWHRQDLDQLEVRVRHRGAPGDARVVLGAEIREVRPGGLVVEADVQLYADDEAAVTDGTVFLPYHRVLRVAAPTGVLWEREEVS